MKVRPRAVIGVLSIAAIAGAAMVAVAGPASAATPPYEPNATYNLGTLSFYDAAGNAVTGGTITAAPFAKYVVASSDDPKPANTVATLFAYTPVKGSDPANWSGEQLSANTTFPVVDVAAPAVVKNAGAHRPVVTMGNLDLTISDFKADFPNANSDPLWQGLYQLRLRTAGNDPKYWVADVLVTGTSWSLVYPEAVTDHASVQSITAPTSVKYGSAAAISGTLTDAVTHAAIAGASVKLYIRKLPSTTYTAIKTLTTSATGAVSYASYKPTVNTYFKLVYAGAAGHLAVTSASKLTKVVQVIAIAAKPTSVHHGNSLKIYGTVKPAGSGQKVTLQKYSGGVWKTVTTATLKSQTLPSGTTTVGYVFTVKLATVGSFKYRVTKAATSTLAAGTSASITVKAT